jgi:hypothetical protein
VEVGVQVAMEAEKGEDPIGTPSRPMVRGEDDIGLTAEQLDGLGEVVGSGVRIPDDRPADDQQVVQGVAGSPP